MDAQEQQTAILRADDHEAWLAGTATEAKKVLQQYPDDRMHAYRVSARELDEERRCSAHPADGIGRLLDR